MAKPRSVTALHLPRDTLHEALARVAGAIDRRPTLPILECFRIESAPPAPLSLTATDLSIQLRTQVEVPAAPAFGACVPARKLLQIVKALPDGSDLSLNHEADAVTLRCGKARFKLAARALADYPAFDLSQTEVVYQLDAGELKAGLSAVAHAMAHQDVRYYLNGVCLHFTATQLLLAASDGHRAARYRLDLVTPLPPPGVAERELILPARSVQELLRLLPESGGTVPAECRCGTNTLALDLGAVQYASKLIEGRFPDLNRVFPTNFAQESAIDRQLLAEAVKRVGLIHEDSKFRQVLVRVEPDRLLFTATNELQEEAQEELPFEGHAQFDLALNSIYLLDVLATLDTPLVVLHLAPDGPSLFTALLDGPPPGEYLVMPIRK